MKDDEPPAALLDMPQSPPVIEHPVHREQIRTRHLRQLFIRNVEFARSVVRR